MNLHSTVAQKCHGNFNLFTAISIYSWQFQFTHGNFNYCLLCLCLTAQHLKMLQFQSLTLIQALKLLLSLVY